MPGRDKASTGKRTRKDSAATGSAGPARLDELLGKGSAEHQVPRLAERILSSTGPIDIPELANRLGKAAPALAQGYDAVEWPQFVEASVRAFKRLQVEEGVLAGDRPVVSICSTVLFSASEEVVNDVSCWLRVLAFLATPAQVSVLTALCRGSREVADGPEVWSKLMARWYPKGTLLNPDWVAQSDLEKRLEEALENDYALAALTRRLEPDTPYDIGDLLRALPQQTTPKALMKFMSRHPDNFRQSPDGKKFCVSRTPNDIQACQEWRTVNPFQAPPVTQMVSADAGRKETGPTPVPMGRPTELQDQSGASSGEVVPSPPEGESFQPQQICQRLDPKQAFRLYHTGLLSQRADQSRRGKLEAWEYYTESNSKCTMAAGDLLNLAESRAKAIRSNDPAVVHELVAQTLEGLVYKVPFGFWNRRVRILSNALNASQLRIGREQRKKYERKLIEFMEWVKKERGFGFYRCDCGARWKSGFSYEEITMQCLTCGAWQKPFRIQDLDTAEQREAREKGEPVESSKKRGGYVQEARVNWEAPSINHSAGGRTVPPKAFGQAKRSWDEANNWQNQERQQRPRVVQGKGGGKGGGSGGGHVVAPKTTAPVPKTTAPVPKTTAPVPKTTAPTPATAVSSTSSRGSAETPAPAPAPPPSTTLTVSEAKYKPGGGGFFARRGKAAGAGPTPPTGSSAVASSSATDTNSTDANSTAPAATSTDSQTVAEPKASAARYSPGGGGFFARRAGARGADTASGSSGATATAVPAATEPQQPQPEEKQKKQEPAPESASAAAEEIAASLGLSVEEARAMGLIPEEDASTPSVQTEVKASSVSEQSKPGSDKQDAADATKGSDMLGPLGISEDEAREMGLLPGASGAVSKTASTQEEGNVSKPNKQDTPVASDGISCDKKTVSEVCKDAVASPSGSTAASPASTAPTAALPTSGTAGVASGIEPDPPATAATEPGKDDEESILASLPEDKLIALKTLGLTLTEAVRMGIVSLPPVEKTVATKSSDVKAAAFAPRKEAPRKAVASKAGPMDVDKSAKTTLAADAHSSADAQALVDAVAAVVTFVRDDTGEEQELARQSSDVAYLLSDAVFWQLLRRLCAEIGALEAGAGCEQQGEQFWKAAWAAAPFCPKDAVSLAESRGYLLPEGRDGMSGLALGSWAPWRRALLMEVSTDLMATRMETGRSFAKLPALAVLEADAASSQASTAIAEVESMVSDLGIATSVNASQSDEVVSFGARLTNIATVATPNAANVPADMLALKGGWSLLQEMGVREAALTLRGEYTVRRQILLRRLDVTAESVCSGKSEDIQRKVADICSDMWASWRKSSIQAPLFSEWSALAATRSNLFRDVSKRISGTSARTTSAVKVFRMGVVPNRGGVPDGYGKESSTQGAASASSAAVTPTEPSSAGARPAQRRQGSTAATPVVATASSGSVSSGPAMPADAGPAKVGAKPAEKKGCESGARSTNKELHHEYRKQIKNPDAPSYYSELEQIRK
eukprot:TRINITY_DN2313_c0_g1_i1.p1 TRINITY_DN2313_c0_g1~~TRINITY_DN2313_c0_g1_i1.p1  ORF type:complete len:1622 (+),score=294.01 TRINITY_DN2313_c0_g1_i1:382-4866(+)